MSMCGLQLLAYRQIVRAPFLAGAAIDAVTHVTFQLSVLLLRPFLCEVGGVVSVEAKDIWNLQACRAGQTVLAAPAEVDPQNIGLSLQLVLFLF